MSRTAYTEEQRAEALELYVAVGNREAAKRTGIPAGTIAAWASRCGVKSARAEQFEEARQAMRVPWEQRRAIVADALGEVAAVATEKLRALIESDQVKAGDLARALAVVIDRAQLLSGGATARTEIIERSTEFEAEAAQVLELVRQAA
jgi:hypothetical protein